jgi:hypothetical protein
MADIKDVNPVGTPISDINLIKYVEAIIALWTQNNPTASWWQFWKRLNLPKATLFLIGCLDDLINYLVEHDIPGEDKKATVLEYMGKIYDLTVGGALPFYLRPFAGMFRNFVINNLMSSAIDWIVEKYQSGTWRPKPTAEIVALWNAMHAELVK